MGTLLGDFRYAFRTLVRQPTYSVVAVLTLVLGIGANTAIFSVVKAVLLDRLPYETADQLVVLWEREPDGTPALVSVPTYLDWRDQAQSFDGVAAFRHVSYAFAGRGDPIDVPSVRATPGLFGVLGSSAFQGRTFVAEEGEPGRDRVVVVSRSFWERHLGASTAIIGGTIQLDAEPYTVVGVMPAAFDFPPGAGIDLWTPLSFDPADAHGRSRRARALNVVGRLGAGASLASAAEEMTLVSSRIAAAHPDSNTGWGALVIGAQEHLVATVRPALMLVLGAVGFLLLIVCANVANLMLARMAARRTEMAVRAALGAGRAQLMRQVLAESLLLSCTGGVLGLVVAWAGVRFVHALPEGTLPRMAQVGLDGGVLAFALTLSIVVALAFGLLPAWQAWRVGLRETIGAASGAGGGPANHRLLAALVVVEVALALILLVGAGLMTRSFARLMRVNPGFEPNNVLAVQIYLPRTKYRDGLQRSQFFDEVLRRVRALPGVRSAAAVTALPLHPVGIDFALPFSIEGRTPPPSGEEPRADIRSATPGYFETMRMALLKGRLIEDRDSRDAPGVLVINETMARRYFDGEDPVGRHIVNPHGRGQVVGVIGDVRHYGLDVPARPELYLSADQNPFPGMALVVRTDGDPGLQTQAIRREVLAVDPEQPLYDVTPMSDAVSRSVFLPRVSMVLLGGFALAALLLAVVGIYGVVSYGVSQRTRELGVRMALGAEAGDTLRLILGRSMTLVGVGLLIGVGGAVALTRLVSGLLFEVSPLDPVVYAGVAALLAAAALLAGYVPARRATRVNPITALRVE